MKLERRLRAVERVLGMAGLCPVCRGETEEPRIALLHDGQPDPEPHEPCPRCGSGPPVATIILRVAGEHYAGAAAWSNTVCG